MNQVINQFRRIFSDNGSGDKDFYHEEMQLREAQQNLANAAMALTRASEILVRVIESRR